jgi:hypothetical protein
MSLIPSNASIKDFFKDGLTSLVDDSLICDHLSDILAKYSFTNEVDVLNTEKTDTVLILESFQNGDYKSLTQLGDSYLFLSGWFFEWASKRRHSSLGIKHYVKKGIESYNYAVDVANYGIALDSDDLHPTLASKLSDFFKDNVCALVDLRSKVNNTVHILDQDLYHELKDSVGYTPKSNNNVLHINFRK